MNDEAKHLIDSISKISDNVKKELKPLIQKLAKNIADNINHPEIKNLATQEGIEDPEEKDVATIMEKLRKKYMWSFAHSTMYSHIQEEYKRAQVKEYSQPERIDAILKDNDRREELKQKIKEFERKNTPSKDIISKARIPDMENYSWECHVAEELAMIAIKMETEHKKKHDNELCKDYAKRAKMIRDSRFATDRNSYEAIVVAAATTQSLKNAIKGEWEFKTLWEILDDMDKCRECIQDNCRSESCTHECHRVVRPMTTKGLKYAIKTNDDLKRLDKEIHRLQEMDNDICRIGKILLENPKAKALMDKASIKRLMYSHIEKDECLQCDMFLEKNPGFLDSDR